IEVKQEGHIMRCRRLCAGLILLPVLLVTAGCQRAGPYTPPGARRTIAENKKKDIKIDLSAAEPLPETLGWLDPGRQPVLSGDVRIDFVHEGTSPEEWKKLAGYWNDGSLGKVVGMIGLPGLPAAALIADKNAAIKVKVPRGLDDPLAYI